MLSSILIQAAKNHGFTLVNSGMNIEFFQRKNGGAERYLIFKTFNELCSINELHGRVLNALPESLRIEPSFSKNCDLVLVYKLKNLSDFKDIEQAALAFEEDPYHFKKYFLYFSEAEEKLIKGKECEDFVSVILKMDEFDGYKKNPLKPSFYSVAARTFIKLPFLEVPKSQKTLQSLTDNVISIVNENNLKTTFEKISAHAQNEDIEALIQELISEELENIKAADSGI